MRVSSGFNLPPSRTLWLLMSPDRGLAPCHYCICHAEILDLKDQLQCFLYFVTEGACSSYREALNLGNCLFFQRCLVGSLWFEVFVEAQEFYKINNFMYGAGEKGRPLQGTRLVSHLLTKRNCRGHWGHCVWCHRPQSGEEQGNMAAAVAWSFSQCILPLSLSVSL